MKREQLAPFAFKDVHVEAIVNRVALYGRSTKSVLLKKVWVQLGKIFSGNLPTKPVYVHHVWVRQHYHKGLTRVKRGDHIFFCAKCVPYQKGALGLSFGFEDITDLRIQGQVPK